MEYGVWKLGKSDFEDIHSLRYGIFVEELGLDATKVFDGIDEFSAHLLWLDENKKPIGTVRMRPEGENVIIIDNFCVKADARRNGTGELMLRMLIERTLRMGERRLIAVVPVALLPMFERIGFKVEHEDSSAFADVVRVFADNRFINAKGCRCCESE